MQRTFLSIDEARGLEGGTAVVVDVLRAYTVAAWALHRGASRIILMDDVEDAVRVAEDHPGALLFKDAHHDSRFQLHNSPAQLLDLDVDGRLIVQRTTAGTRGAVAVRGADLLLCTGFVSAAATAAHLARSGSEHVTFVVTGTDGTAEEDRACAEYVAALLEDPHTDAGPYVARAGRSANARRLRKVAAAGDHGVDEADVDMALEVDRFDFAMQADERDGHLSLTRRD